MATKKYKRLELVLNESIEGYDGEFKPHTFKTIKVVANMSKRNKRHVIVRTEAAIYEVIGNEVIDNGRTKGL